MARGRARFAGFGGMLRARGPGTRGQGSRAPSSAGRLSPILRVLSPSVGGRGGTMYGPEAIARRRCRGTRADGQPCRAWAV